MRDLYKTGVLVIVCTSMICADTITVNPGESIQTAIDSAIGGDTIEVAAGVYPESITLKSGIAVIGAGPDLTIIDGDPNTSVVTAIGCDEKTVMQGFTIQNGTGTQTDDSDPLTTLGGGMYVSFGSPRIVDCVFGDNSAAMGGAMCNFLNAAPIVIGCVFTDNQSDVCGGAVAGYGYSSPVFINCLFTSNSSDFGGAISHQDLFPATVINCTFTGNNARASGGAIFNVGAPTTIANSILWQNEPDQIFDTDGQDNQGYLVATHSNIQGGYGQPDAQNIDSDPMFVSDIDLSLQLASPCIDSGDSEIIPPEMQIETDIRGLPRFVDGDCDLMTVIDMGAYEFHHLQIGDLNEDCSVGWTDLEFLSDYWLSSEPAADIDNSDNKNIVNCKDLAVVARYWLEGL